MLFTTQATRYYRQIAPPPEPIGKRASSPAHGTTSAAEILLTKKSKERSGVSEYEYEVAGMRKRRSRPPSVRSSHGSSVRSMKSRTTVQRKPSRETVRSRISITSSLNSSRLSVRFSRLILQEPASLTNIPTELIHAIVSYLSGSDLLNLICVCQHLRSETTMLLYENPYFMSTYRFGQFVTTVSHIPHLADLVRELDLSHISKLSEDSGLAGWREWKYRDEALYSLYPNQDGESNVHRPTNKHPPAHPLLLKHSTGGHDIPLGALMHIVKSCPHLRYHFLLPRLILFRKINLNNLHIAADYVILPSAPPPRWKPLLPSLHKPPTFHPTAFTKLLFISDVPKSNNWRGAEFRPLRYEEFVNALCSLEDLEKLSLRRAVWIKQLFAEEIVRRAGGELGLRQVNFTGCGMNPGHTSWTKKWTGRRNESVRSLIIFD